MGDPHVVAGHLRSTRVEGPEAEVARLRARVAELEAAVVDAELEAMDEQKRLAAERDQAAALLRRLVGNASAQDIADARAFLGGERG